MDRILNDGDLMLRPASLADVESALEWYRDPEVVRFSEGTADPYGHDRVERMYSYLKDSGHFFMIEVLSQGAWKPVWGCMPDEALYSHSYRKQGLLVQRIWKAFNHAAHWPGLRSGMG